MARPVNKQRQQEQRLRIIDAAFTRFAADGFDRTTTASICRTAGVGSGTFFHYFPTKIDVLLGILTLGARETSEILAGLVSREPVAALLAYLDHEAANLRDPRAAGFVRAVGAVAHDERVAVALAATRTTTETALTAWVTQAQQQGAIRTDLDATRTTRWLIALVDGFASQVAEGDQFDAEQERDILLDTARRFLAPPSG
ncbi:TetR/AcrR family transcriptional regulator [Natronosporangium hydrolyticum]|uniref:TetR/AcrR family transcriptional regulator n=1 Tax=Natronosporangium hydrolyticum TaxID=2811111 RepID=A0A895YCZ2_9ACTN|nr:TetR/AcrR family transcriptional regulator [Natronosporangium hydrolyticum]QSB15391.1 TetR/AcrR family transcriptional regulator [Natronosporangium hydrolyticum]